MIIKQLLNNPYFRFLVASVIYTFWVIWMQNFWLYFGLLIVADIFITRLVNWRFWNKKNGKDNKNKFSADFIDVFVIAAFAALVLRVYFIVAYSIPTSSMEKTICVGDYIFVNKTAYGPRLPNTPLSLPFTHNTIPFTKSFRSYFSWIKLPYKRLNGLTDIKNYDIVVFNFPEGDTVLINYPEQNETYYTLLRKYGKDYVSKNFKSLERPVDKRENYIKRVIGIPGDTVKIEHGMAMVNGKMEELPEDIQYNYFFISNDHLDSGFFDQMDVSLYDVNLNEFNSVYEIPLTKYNLEQMRLSKVVKGIRKHENFDPASSSIQIFPFSRYYLWTEDNYGPLVVPKKNVSVQVTVKNLPLYKRIIHVYEKNNLEVRNDSIFINGNYAESYTFKMNYYFMMGDNRHNSNDSRYWGFVPEDHIIGKAMFIWLSIDKNKRPFKNIRWKRMFKSIQ